MIEIKDVTKKYDNQKVAVNHATLTIPTGSLVGLVGSNGAGKSTLFRILCGINSATEGTITIDGENIEDNVKIKREVFFLPDNSYYFQGATIKDMADFYSIFYTNFDRELFVNICDLFELKQNMKITSLSKGMKKQVMLIMGVSAKTKYLILDEAFDGIDAITRQTFKDIFLTLVRKNNMTVIIATHNIREIEDICDDVCLIFKSNIVFNMPLQELKRNYHKVRLEFKEVPEKVELKELTILSSKKDENEHVITLSVNGNKQKLKSELSEIDAEDIEITPLSLEEIFFCELEARGYEVKTNIDI